MAFVWDSEQYLRFESERNLAIRDLIARLTWMCRDEQICKILDVGCGAGNSTRLLADSFTNVNVVGIDNSQNMIDKANSLQLDACSFKLCDINHGLTSLGQFDIVFANASLQWVDEQEKFFRDVARIVKNGFVAVQIPQDGTSPFHQCLQHLAASDKWKTSFRHSRVFKSLNIGEYFDILSLYSRQISLWETTYHHILTDIKEIIEWYKGSGLRPYLQQLNENDARCFEYDLLESLKSVFIPQKNGMVLLKVPRLFFIAKMDT